MTMFMDMALHLTMVMLMVTMVWSMAMAMLFMDLTTLAMDMEDMLLSTQDTRDMDTHRPTKPVDITKHCFKCVPASANETLIARAFYDFRIYNKY